MPESSSGTGFTYRAFNSYSHRDKAWGDWLHKALETYRVPTRLIGLQTAAGVIPRRLHPVFRDREELASATDLNQRVEQALRESANLIVICSPHSARSRWVNEEVLAFKRMGRGKRIFCLIVDGEPGISDWPGHEGEECFCPALRHALDAHGQPAGERTEPVAADARAGKDGKTGATLKLIAGLLGVGLDQLKQREQHRQMRRMAAITALALVVMAITSVLAIYALISRHQAVVAQHHAVVAQQAAQRRQKQAEDLVNFMLGDLSTKLRQVDRLDILSAVDDKAMAYFKSLPATDVNATELAQRAKALQRIGEVRMDRSKLSDSMAAFQQALRLNKQLVDASPNDAMRQDTYAENLLWVGFVDWNEGRLDRAETTFQQAAAALQRAARLAPFDNDVQHHLDDVYDDLGQVAGARGELGAEIGDYTKDLALDVRMAKAHPRDVLWQNAIGDAHSNLGEISLAHGRLGDAVGEFLKSQQQMVNVTTGNPHNRQMQAQLYMADAVLGRTLALTGHVKLGAGYVKAAVGIASELIAFDPGHADWRDSHAYYSGLLGQLLLEQGDAAGASQPIDTALAIETKLVAKDPQNAEWRRHLAEAQLAGARLALARKQPATARQLATQARANMQPLLAAKSPKAALVRIEANLDLLLGQLAATNDHADAPDHYTQEALMHMRALAAHSSDPRDLAILVEAVLATSKTAEARPVIRRLQSMGFRPPAFVALLLRHGIPYPADPATTRQIAGVIVLAHPQTASLHL
ncbi:MAG: toll/interleukin-1 receptor domain-containing protein [Rhodanobacteraceae bacterium]